MNFKRSTTSMAIALMALSLVSMTSIQQEAFAQQFTDPKYIASAEVDIRDGVVVPEFGTIAAMILAVAIISIIAVSAKSRLSIIPRY